VGRGPAVDEESRQGKPGGSSKETRGVGLPASQAAAPSLIAPLPLPLPAPPTSPPQRRAMPAT
jgi:hypothetical protein